MNRVNKFLMRRDSRRNVAVLLSCFSLILFAAHKTVSTAQGSPDEIPLTSKTQADNYILNGYSKRLYFMGEPVAFTHKYHATQKKYRADKSKQTKCADCHHTDQPPSALTGVLKTSTRAGVLTTKLLSEESAAPVMACRSCHDRDNVKPSNWPENPQVTYPEGKEYEAFDWYWLADPDFRIISRDEAYHVQCLSCHLRVKKIETTSSVPIKCVECHQKQ